MKYWLLKSEPSVYSIDDLKRDKVTGWEGIRNYSARNFLKEMKKGDLAFFYHSNANPPAIAGVARVNREFYPDPDQFNRKSRYFDAKADASNPRWFQIDIQFVEKFKNTFSLEDIKTTSELKEMVLVKRGRLSVQAVSPVEWKFIHKRCNS